MFQLLKIIYQNYLKILNFFYKAEHKCVDAIITEYDLDQGLSHYNQSRYFELFLKNKIKILAYDDDLTPDLKVSSSRYLNNQFDFILLRKDKAQEYKDSLDLALLTSDFILDCGNFEVLIFKDKFSLESL